MRPEELTEILTISRQKNTENNISGLLLYSGCTFIQVLEGQEENVKAIYYTIIQDERHKNIVKLSSGHIEKRAFPDWSMGFVAVDTTKLNDLKGYINPDNLDFESSTFHYPAIKILKSYLESNYLTPSLL